MGKWQVEANNQYIKKIGGTCAGTTTAMSWIQSNFTKLGYTVLFVPETATELITGGVAPWTCGSNMEYQKCQTQLQLEKEKIFEQGALTMPREKILIVCDRWSYLFLAERFCNLYLWPQIRSMRKNIV